MRVIQVADREEGSRKAAEIFATLADASPEQPVGLATGSTMSGVYAALAEMRFTPQTQHAFALDEYQGLSPTNVNSYAFELNEKFAHSLRWQGELHVPGQGKYGDNDGAERFEKDLAELGPISVQLLGLGSNGHIAFNEPGSSFESRTRVVELHEQTRLDNARFFDGLDQVPTHATSQGLATIAQANNLLLLIFGENKKAALEAALNDPSSETPLAAMLDHPNLTLITDLSI